MNRYLALLVFALFSTMGFCAENIEESKNNPGINLNPQDVPIFSDGNPLEGLNTFAVIPPYSFKNPKVSKEIESLIEKELGSIGTVTRSKSEDVTGLGSGSMLNIQVGQVSKWDGGEMPFSRVTLSVETSVIISKTNVKSRPRVWAINDFVDSPFDLKTEDQLVGAIQKLLREFVESYRFANPDQQQKPTFYVYY